MDIALRIFAEKGSQNAAIFEISNAAGFSEATIGENFGTKEDLLFAIPEKISTENLQETERALDLLQQGLILHLKLEDAQALGEILQAKERLEKDMLEGVRKTSAP